MAASTPSNNDLLSRPQAAEYLGVQVQTMASWASTGKYGLPFIRVGRSIRYRKSDLDAWLQRRTCGAEAS